jgi:hypothetical protein
MATLDNKGFILVRDALTGGGGFKDGSYLVKYPREKDEKYEARKAIAWYDNTIAPAAQKFAGYLMSKPVYRAVKNPKMSEFLFNSTWAGDSLNSFISSFIVQANAGVNRHAKRKSANARDSVYRKD